MESGDEGAGQEVAHQHYVKVCRGCETVYESCGCGVEGMKIRGVCSSCVPDKQVENPNSDDPLDTLLEFHQAFFLLKLGHKVTRKAWDDAYVFIDLLQKKMYRVVNGLQVSWVPTEEDLMASDWVLYRN